MDGMNNNMNNNINNNSNNDQITQQPQLQYYYQQPMPAPVTEDPESKMAAHKLCYISLGCYFVPIIIGIITTMFAGMTEEGYAGDTYNTLSAIEGALIFLGQITGFVLAIVCRVKYPKNFFGKVLLIVYLVLLVLAVIAIIAIIALTAFICNACMGEAGSCMFIM